MANRDGTAAIASADNETAEGLPNEDFFFEGEDGQLVGQGDDTEEVTADDAADGTSETQEELDADGTEQPAVGEVPAAVKPAAKAPVTPAVAPPAPAQTPAPAQAPASDSAPVQRTPTFHEHVRANFPAALDHVVAQGTFRMSPEEAEILDPAVAPVVERYGARVFLQTMTAVSQLMHDTLPGVVNSLMSIRNDGASQEEKFYSEYGLDKSKGAEITKIAYTLRQFNPNLHGKAYADEVARVSHAVLGTKPPAAKPAGQAPAKPGVPAQPGAKVISRQAFTPAAKAGGAGQPNNRRPTGSPPPEKNPLFDLAAMLGSGVELDD